jgi:hypothetical protein
MLITLVMASEVGKGTSAKKKKKNQNLTFDPSSGIAAKGAPH